jgi:hypothetical protein
MDVRLIITVAILVLDAVISVWNSYVAGEVSNGNRGLGIFFYVLGGFLSMAYVISIMPTILLAMLKYIPYTIANFLLSFNFAFLGATIIMWGVIATATSIIIATGTKHWGAGFIIVYAISALIYDTWEYMVDFGGAVKDIVTVLAKDKGGVIVTLVIVLGLALAIGFIITYLAYKAGKGQ